MPPRCSATAVAASLAEAMATPSSSVRSGTDSPVSEAHAIARRERRAVAHQHRLLPLRAPGVERLAGEVEGHELDEARGGVVLAGFLAKSTRALGVEQEDGLRAQRERPAIRLVV